MSQDHSPVVAGVVAVTIGRWTVDRKAPPYQRRREGDEDRADTDVFAAVQPGPAEEAR